MLYFTIQYFAIGLLMIAVPMLLIGLVIWITRNFRRIRREFEDDRQRFPMAREHYGSVSERERRELREKAEKEVETLVPQRDLLEKRIERLKEKKNPSSAVAGRIRRDETQLREINEKLARYGC